MGKTYERVATLYYWPAMRKTISDFVNGCAPCALQRLTNLKGMAHHLLETVYRPREVVYVDLVGQVTGIRSQYKYVLTCVDGYLNYLATRPIQSERGRTVAAAIHDVMCREMSFPTRLTADRGSEPRWPRWEWRCATFQLVNTN